jgi:glutaredoxin 2
VKNSDHNPGFWDLDNIVPHFTVQLENTSQYLTKVKNALSACRNALEKTHAAQRFLLAA